ncbi:hypothetical protein [Pantoea sp. Fr+CA_20]|uniref:hypothetical protein n=1 Tax=Pantoea sp. Fr+CA_20 TaxID=2929506 RepID=UPI0021195A3F|nr:hypothetical protein [Pantoea sp. Fr+CA_20]
MSAELAGVAQLLAEMCIYPEKLKRGVLGELCIAPFGRDDGNTVLLKGIAETITVIHRFKIDGSLENWQSNSDNLSI